MSIKEQIRAGLERIVKEILYSDSSRYDASDDNSWRNALENIMNVLDTLPEQPVTDCHELKKHILEWTELMVGASFPEQDGDYISEQDYRNVIKKTARHFAEWGAEHLKR